MNKEMNEIIRQIRTDLRLSMNGVVSTSMREKGMNYRMNFGVNIPKLRQMVKKYSADASLAEALWETDTRELKILATMLYPLPDFTKTEANKWVNEIPNQEIREQLCRNLLQELPFANELAQVWIADKETEIRLTGYCLFTRLSIVHPAVARKIPSFLVVEQALTDLRADSMLMLQSALNALKYVGRLSKGHADAILQEVAAYETSENSQEREIFDVLTFEFRYFYTAHSL